MVAEERFGLSESLLYGVVHARCGDVVTPALAGWVEDGRRGCPVIVGVLRLVRVEVDLRALESVGVVAVNAGEFPDAPVNASRPSALRAREGRKTLTGRRHSVTPEVLVPRLRVPPLHSLNVTGLVCHQNASLI